MSEQENSQITTKGRGSRQARKSNGSITIAPRRPMDDDSEAWKAYWKKPGVPGSGAELGYPGGVTVVQEIIYQGQECAFGSVLSRGGAVWSGDPVWETGNPPCSSCSRLPLLCL